MSFACAAAGLANINGRIIVTYERFTPNVPAGAGKMSPTPMLPEPGFVLILEKRRVLWSHEAGVAVNARRPVAAAS